MTSKRRMSVSTNPSARRKSETFKTTSLQIKKGRRISCGVAAAVRTKTAVTVDETPRLESRNLDPVVDNASSVMRMGTRISLSAIHRERLRLTSEVMHNGLTKTYKNQGGSLDLDYDTMEFKSILPIDIPSKKEAAVVLHTSELLDETEAVPYDDPANESLSESLMERFDNMETDDTLPERQIVSVTILKDQSGNFQNFHFLKLLFLWKKIYLKVFSLMKILILHSPRNWQTSFAESPKSLIYCYFLGGHSQTTFTEF